MRDITYLLVQHFVQVFHQYQKELIFFQNIFKLEARDLSIQGRKKLFCHVIIKDYLRNLLCNFLIKVGSTWKCKIKEQTPLLTLLYSGRTVLMVLCFMCLKVQGLHDSVKPQGPSYRSSFLFLSRHLWF